MKKALLTAAMLVLTAGQLSGSALTENIAGELDSGGSYYLLTDMTGALEAEKRELGSMPSRLSASGMPDALAGYMFRLADSAMLSLVLAGAEGELAYGASSVPSTPAGEEKLFRNTLVLRHGKNSGKGLIWHLFGRKNHDLTQDLHAIPANSLLAADFEFYPAEAVPGVTAVMNRLFSNPAINDRIPEILKGMAGSWGILAVPLEKQPLPGIMAAAPDKDGAAFRLIAELARQNPAETVLALGNFRILHFKDENMTVFYSSQECMDALANEYKLLKDTPQHGQLSRKLDTEGTGFLYTSPELSLYIRRFFLNRTMHIPDMPRSLTVFKRQEHGFKAVGNSSADFSSLELKVNFSFAVNLLADYVESEYRARSRREKMYRMACRENLARLGKAIAQYQEKHGGEMPPAGVLEGMTALVNDGAVHRKELLCPSAHGDYPAKDVEAPGYSNLSYVYFGPWEKEADGNLPLIADWHLNHRNHFSVLLKNGTVVSFDEEKLDSFRRLVSILQSKYKYREKDFRKIMAIAVKLEKLCYSYE